MSCPVDCPLHLVLSCAADETPSSSSTSSALTGGSSATAATNISVHASAGTRAVQLGVRLLSAVFEHQPEARDEVLRACQLGATKLEACLPQVLLLSRLCRAQPGLIAGHMQPLKDCLGHFSALPPEVAMALLRALWPLCKVRRELQDHGAWVCGCVCVCVWVGLGWRLTAVASNSSLANCTHPDTHPNTNQPTNQQPTNQPHSRHAPHAVIMLLRKVMYGRDLNSRVVAIRGFVYLILEQLRAAPAAALDESGPSQASGSQASLSQVSALSSGSGVNLLQELAGVLRRCAAWLVCVCVGGGVSCWLRLY